MRVCAAPACVMPAKWAVVLVTRPQVHYEPMQPAEVHLGFCFCDIHRKQAKGVDALFSNDAKIGLDRQYIQKDMPAPDWARCELRFDNIDPRANEHEVKEATKP